MQIKNAHFFYTTEILEFNWVVHGDGCEVGFGLLSLLTIEPQKCWEINWQSGPWYSSWTSSVAGEIYLTITAKLLRLTCWAEIGHIISSTQVQLPAKLKALHVSNRHSFSDAFIRTLIVSYQ